MWTFGQETAENRSSLLPRTQENREKKKTRNQAAANILQMISFNLLQARFHLFLRNTKRQHWPLSRWSRANISLDKRLEDDSWHRAASQKKTKKKTSNLMLWAQRVQSGSVPARPRLRQQPQINTTGSFISVLRRYAGSPGEQVCLLGLIKVQRVCLSLLSRPGVRELGPPHPHLLYEEQAKQL